MAEKYDIPENPFITLTSDKVKAGRFTVVEDIVCVNGHEQPYDYLEIRPGVCILPIKNGSGRFYRCGGDTKGSGYPRIERRNGI